MIISDISLAAGGSALKSCAIRLISTSILGRTGPRTIYVLAAVLNLIMAVIVYRNIPDVEPKTKASYKDVLKGMLKLSKFTEQYSANVSDILPQ